MGDMRMIQLICRLDSTWFPIAGMCQHAVYELMHSFIGRWIRIGRAAQESQFNNIILNAVTVFTIIQYADTIPVFRKIDPFLSWHLKFGPIPAGITIRRTLNISPLNIIVRCFNASDMLFSQSINFIEGCPRALLILSIYNSSHKL